MTLLLLLVLLAAPAQADFFIHHWDDHYEPVHSTSIAGDILYYGTTQNYGETGALNPAPNSDSYKRVELDGTIQLGLLDRMSLFGRLTWGWIQSDNSLAQATNSGLLDQTIGGTYRVYEAETTKTRWFPFSFDLQGQGDFPGYSNAGDDQTRTPYLGDQTVDVTGGGFVVFPVWQDGERAYALEGGAGYTFRTSHFSPQVPWTLGMSTLPRDSGVTARFFAYGNTSMNQDATIPVSKPSGFATGAGGTLITDAVNPESIILRGELGFQFNKASQIYVAYEQSVWGENAPDGQLINVGLKFNFGPGYEEQNAFDKANQGLQQYTIEARVTRANDRLNLVKIDKGAGDNIEKGQVFDIFTVNQQGEPVEAVARAQVTSVKSDEAVLTVIEYFKEQYINEGFVAKRLVQ